MKGKEVGLGKPDSQSLLPIEAAAKRNCGSTFYNFRQGRSGRIPSDLTSILDFRVYDSPSDTGAICGLRPILYFQIHKLINKK